MKIKIINEDARSTWKMGHVYETASVQDFINTWGSDSIYRDGEEYDNQLAEDGELDRYHPDIHYIIRNDSDNGVYMILKTWCTIVTENWKERLE